MGFCPWTTDSSSTPSASPNLLDEDVDGDGEDRLRDLGLGEVLVEPVPQLLAHPVGVDADQLDLDGRESILILNHPHNPTGAVYERPELEAVADTCRELGIVVVADEIYALTTLSPARPIPVWPRPSSTGHRLRRHPPTPTSRAQASVGCDLEGPFFEP